MAYEDYSETILVTSSAEKIYTALTTGFDKWWTCTDGQAFRQVGDRVKFTFPPLDSYWVFEAKTLEPRKKIMLECVEAYHVLNRQPGAPRDEWLGTVLIWDIVPDGDVFGVNFVHNGLTPDKCCYEVCEDGWNVFFVNSLKAYLEKGAGTPFRNSMI